MAKQTGGIRLYWHPDFRIFSNYHYSRNLGKLENPRCRPSGLPRFSRRFRKCSASPALLPPAHPQRPNPLVQVRPLHA